MNNDIPKVDYRFGDIWLITDFVNPRVVLKFTSEGDALVEDATSFIRDAFTYPMVNGYPSSDGKLKRYHKNFLLYHFKSYVYYMWSFPAEVLAQGKGICIDTSNLAASLLVPDIDAWVCLGEVRTSDDDQLLGYHAWIVCPYKNDIYLCETTIHQESENKVKMSQAYDRVSNWAQQGNLYYVEQARYNYAAFSGNSGIVANMGLPARRVRMYGAEATRSYSKKRLAREWRQEEIAKTHQLQAAWG